MVGSMSYEKLLKQTVMLYEGLATGTMTLEAITEGGGGSTVLLSESLETGSLLIWEDQTSLIYGDTGEIFESSMNDKISRVQKLFYNLQYQISINYGGIKLNRLEGNSAFVGRR